MATETVRSRFQKVMSGQLPEDRLPVIEWASWWNLTIDRWKSEGLPAELDEQGIHDYFHLDRHYQQWVWQFDGKVSPKVSGYNSEVTVWVENDEDYDALRPHIYPEVPGFDESLWQRRAAEQQAGDALVWMTFHGFFWWPRVLFGVEPHLYAFYDQPELMHRMNQDLADFIVRRLDEFCAVCTPDFITFAEDMSYNHGPMISKELFDEFMAPYYRQVIPAFKKHGIIPIIDSDGGVEPLIDWFSGVGLEGILPLERMAGVDVNRMRAQHPTWKMIGGYDKMVMHLGEARMREEFERLLPAMRSGYFIPSVDHQTPPGVSLQDYLLYRRLLDEYAEKACH